MIQTHVEVEQNLQFHQKNIIKLLEEHQACYEYVSYYPNNPDDVFPSDKTLRVTCDVGGNEGYRVNIVAKELQELEVLLSIKILSDPREVIKINNLLVQYLEELEWKTC